MFYMLCKPLQHGNARQRWCQDVIVSETLGALMLGEGAVRLGFGWG